MADPRGEGCQAVVLFHRGALPTPGCFFWKAGQCWLWAFALCDPVTACSQGWARWQVLESCKNLNGRFTNHYSWSAPKEGAQPLIQQTKKLRPREGTFMPIEVIVMPRVTQWAGEQGSDSKPAA